MSEPSKEEAKAWRQREQDRKGAANISFAARKNDDDLNYLGMDHLAKSIEGKGACGKNASLVKDAVNCKPVRNAVGHAVLLTGNAKHHLSLTFERTYRGGYARS